MCAWLKRDIEELSMYYVVSMLSLWHDIGPYLAYMGRVREYVKVGRVVIGIEANAFLLVVYQGRGLQ